MAKSIEEHIGKAYVNKLEIKMKNIFKDLLKRKGQKEEQGSEYVEI